MEVEISFNVQRAEVASHHTDRRFSKSFDVDWLGRPYVGEGIELDVSPPGDDNEFAVRDIYWSTESPPLLHLEPITILEDEQEQLDRYVAVLEERGWK
jgi:hypothetical protein